MAIEVTRQQASCGALIRGVDLTKDLAPDEVAPATTTGEITLPRDQP